MLVECATTSTNNGSTCSSSTVSSNTANCTSSTVTPAVTVHSSSTTAMTTSANLTSVNSSLSAVVVNSPSSTNVVDEPSSGSNSCSNSIGNSISTASNSISNSNSIGTSWRVGNSTISDCNGRTSVDRNCEASSEFSGKSSNEELMHIRNAGDYGSRSASTIDRDCSASADYKYGSPAFDYKNNGEHKQSCDQNRGKNMVDVEACLANTPPHLLIRSLSSLSHHSTQLSTLPRSPEQEQVGCQTLQKGVLHQARDRLFSRWKERYFVLTRDYLACFRRGSTKYSEMGSFIFKVNLASVEGVWWEERRGGAVIAVGLPREGRVLLRARAHDDANLQVWFRALLDATTASRLRRSALRRGTSTTHLHINHTTTLPHPSPSGMSGGSSSSDCCVDDSVRLPDKASSQQQQQQQQQHQRAAGCPTGSLDTDPPSTPPSSLTSSHKFSTTTSSGSGCGSSVASSPGLGTGNYNPPGGWSPRSRFSLVESPRRLISSATTICPPKTRHSLCLEPQDLPPPTSRLVPVLQGRAPADHPSC